MDRYVSLVRKVESPAIAGAYDFEGIGSIVDVAGGRSSSRDDLVALSRMRRTLYDRPDVVEGAKSSPLVPVMDRCTLAAGDMFSAVPAGADAYIISELLASSGWRLNRVIPTDSALSIVEEVPA